MIGIINGTHSSPIHPIQQILEKQQPQIINPAIKQAYSVMPDLIRHPVPAWVPAFAGMTTSMYLVAGVIKGVEWL